MLRIAICDDNRADGERLLVARAHMQELKQKHMEFVRRMV